jgi:Ca2+-binding EF-hand superfamily protein
MMGWASHVWFCSSETIMEPIDVPPLSSFKLKSVHAACDVDSDGKISVLDLVELHKKTHTAMANNHIDETFRNMDIDGDGRIDPDEFSGPTWPYEEVQKSSFSDARAKFELADDDNSGFLSRSELISVVFPETSDAMQHKLATKAMQSFDSDKDSHLNMDEFLQINDAGNMHEAVLGSMQREFDELDVNGDGKLSHNEMMSYEAGISNLRMNFKHIFGFADTNQDGYLTVKELVKARPKMKDSDAHLLLRELHGYVSRNQQSEL